MDETLSLERIVRHLMMNYPFISDVGIKNGQMGGVLFFYQYAKYSGKTYYADYADELLDCISKNLNENIPVNFGTGLCGIGWGIEYLLQNNFIEGNSDEILEDIDLKIMERDIRMIGDVSFDTGLEGILCYVLTRMEAHNRQGCGMPFNDLYINEFCKVVHSIPGFNSKFIQRIEDVNTGRINYGQKLVLTDVVDTSSSYLSKNLADYSLGLHGGLTGMALNRMMQ